MILFNVEYSSYGLDEHLRDAKPKPQNEYFSNFSSLVKCLPGKLLQKEAEMPGKVLSKGSIR